MGTPSTFPRPPSPTETTLLSLPTEILIEIFSYFIVVKRYSNAEDEEYAPLQIIPTSSPVPKHERNAYCILRTTCRRFRTVTDSQLAFQRYFPTDVIFPIYKPITYYRYHDLCESLYAPRAAIQCITLESIPQKPDPTVTENAMVRSMNARIISRLDTFGNLQEVRAHCKPPGVEENSEYTWCANPLPTHGTGFLHAEAILGNLARPASKLDHLSILKLRGLEPEPHDVFEKPHWFTLLGKLKTFEIELVYKPPHTIYDMDQELYEDPTYPEDAFGPSNPELRLRAFAEQFGKWSPHLKNLQYLKLDVQEAQDEHTNRASFRFNPFFHNAVTDGGEPSMPQLSKLVIRRVAIDRGFMHFLLTHKEIAELMLERSGTKHSRYGPEGGLTWGEIYQGFMALPKLRVFENRNSSKDEKRMAPKDGEGWFNKLNIYVENNSLQQDGGDGAEMSWLALG